MSWFCLECPPHPLQRSTPSPITRTPGREDPRLPPIWGHPSQRRRIQPRRPPVGLVPPRPSRRAESGGRNWAGGGAGRSWSRAGARVAARERAGPARPHRHRGVSGLVGGRRPLGWGGVGRSTGRTMNAKKKGRTLPPCAAKASGPAPGHAGRLLGARKCALRWGGLKGDLFWRDRGELLAQSARRDSVSTVEPREHGGGGTLLGTVPHFPGNPRARGVLGSLGGLEGSRVRGAGRSWEPKPASRRACRAGGSTSRARSLQPARPVTSRVLPGWGRRRFWSRSGRAAGWGTEREGGRRGWVGEPAPPPGKQALPHILPAPRPFPAPFPAPEGPRETPLPGPRRAGGRSLAPRQEAGARPRPR